MGSIGKTALQYGIARNEFTENGTTFQLNKPLVYANDKQLMADGADKTIRAFEDKRGNGKIEYACVVLNDGTILDERRGGKRSVKTSTVAMRNGDVYTHIHPRDEGELGGTFSIKDLSNFLSFNLDMYRAAAKEGTYVISKNPEYTSSQGRNFLDRYQRFHSTTYQKYREIGDRLGKKYTDAAKSLMADPNLTNREKQERNNKLYANYEKQQRLYTNNYLTDLHNWLVSNASKYQLTYGLEGR